MRRVGSYLSAFMVLAAVATTSAAHAAAPPAASSPPPPSAASAWRWELASELRLLMQWWPGEFDNHEQVVRQSGGGLSPLVYAPFRRVHTTVRAVDAPALGERVLAIETRSDDAAEPLRRELVSIVPDIDARALRVRRYAVNSPAMLDDRAALTSATPPGLEPLAAGCDVLLRFVGGQFQGSLASTSCPAARGRAEYELAIGPRFVWERSQARDARSGAITEEMAPGSGFGWYQQTRARRYTCNVFGDEQGVMAKTRFVTQIHLHDQGGAAEFAWPDGRTLVFTIHTRAFTSAPNHEYPLFRVHEKGNPVPIAYAYAVDANTRFGLNLGWFYIRCYDDADATPQELNEGRT
jgi:hypothetical protein